MKQKMDPMPLAGSERKVGTALSGLPPSIESSASLNVRTRVLYVM